MKVLPLGQALPGPKPRRGNPFTGLTETCFADWRTDLLLWYSISLSCSFRFVASTKPTEPSDVHRNIGEANGTAQMESTSDAGVGPE